jgi:hypothetical protein
MEEITDYNTLFIAWSCYCQYLKMYIEVKGKPPSEYIKISNHISIQAKKDAMIEYGLNEDIEAYNEYNKYIDRKAVLVQYIANVEEKLKKQNINESVNDYIFNNDFETFARIMEYCELKRDDY